MKKVFILLNLVILLIATNSDATVFKLSNINRYIGIEADAKPSTRVPTGSIFVESDTGGKFIFNGASWEQVNPAISNVLNAAVSISAHSFMDVEGEGYLAHHTFSAVASAATVDILIRTAALKQPLVEIVVQATSTGDFQLFEIPTTSADGTPVALLNKNRSSSNTSDSLVFHTPTVSVTGTELLGKIITGSGGSVPNPISGQASLTCWVLDNSTDYLVRATNTAVGAEDITIHIIIREGDS